MTQRERYTVRLAQTEADLIAAQRLRYRVFVEELGSDGPTVDHESRLERDEYDEIFDHLVLVDCSVPEGEDHVIGVYRLLPSERVGQTGRFYSENEFDLSPLRQSGRSLLELGRSCVHPDHRGGTSMFHLWNGLSEYVLDRKIEILFGAASFFGTDIAELKAPLSYLHHNHLAPPALRVKALGPTAVALDQLSLDELDPKAASKEIPPLIKGYLRLGGFVGDGAFVDHEFNTTDVCLIMDTARMSHRHYDYYTRGRGTE